MQEHDDDSDELRRKAMVDGYMAGAGLWGDQNGASEPYTGNSNLMVCWLWGYEQGKRSKIDS